MRAFALLRAGQCVNNRGETIGFVNLEDSLAGSKEEEYLGCSKDQLSGDEVKLVPLSMLCGNVQLGSPA